MKTKIWEITFMYHGEEDVQVFWENSLSRVDSFIENMTAKGGYIFICKKLAKEF